MAEVLTLRRKLQGVHADNALLTQNFMMVKHRLADVAAQRESDQNSMQVAGRRSIARTHARTDQTRSDKIG